MEPAVNDELDERQSLADLAGAAGVKAGAARFAVKRSRSRDSFVLENADVRLVVDRRARGGWNIEVTVRAVFLATLPGDLTRYLLRKSDPRDAALSLFAKLRASSARFSSSDDAERGS